MEKRKLKERYEKEEPNIKKKKKKKIKEDMKEIEIMKEMLQVLGCTYAK